MVNLCGELFGAGLPPDGFLALCRLIDKKIEEFGKIIFFLDNHQADRYI